MADYGELAAAALIKALKIDPQSRPDTRAAGALLSQNADVEIRNHVLKHPADIGKTISVWALAHGNVDSAMKGAFDREVPEARRKLSDKQLAWIDRAAARRPAAEALQHRASSPSAPRASRRRPASAWRWSARCS